VAEKYRPSNGSEGSAFFESWCSHCARDKSMREGAPFEECDDSEVCPIIANTFAYEVDDPKYPVEWIVDADGPKCTAFVPAGSDVPQPRCEKTVDMFPEVKP
jgi:hypothetical protein